jgi:hypothetical protein
MTSEYHVYLYLLWNIVNYFCVICAAGFSNRLGPAFYASPTTPFLPPSCLPLLFRTASWRACWLGHWLLVLNSGANPTFGLGNPSTCLSILGNRWYWGKLCDFLCTFYQSKRGNILCCIYIILDLFYYVSIFLMSALHSHTLPSPFDPHASWFDCFSVVVGKGVLHILGDLFECFSILYKRY